MEFANPYYLFLLLVVPLLLYWYFQKGQYREATMRFSNLDVIPNSLSNKGKNKNLGIIGGKLLIIVFLNEYIHVWLE